ncbi:PhzF family phenazine biosynthesis protein [Halioglobus maricola]|uniref:PhzF family phenazine biosynthesis protein n=1 Tax=Halioglobus maricola TaxID=2601894 RepID=A0A5P9NJ19_9GAMM|nr:PhzF family phenazine biosynthesis protein [Halioglobus maricola]QFU75863.1 PhzF family phenazine biosynthesis protein [Halioglobus maricola]
MNIPIYQVDAFTSSVFGGNPAAVMPLEQWLADEQLQAIAAENNLSETAFLVASDAGWELRWFTPSTEVDLCGHATLASAHALAAHMGVDAAEMKFATRSGELLVRRSGDSYTLDFPAYTVTADAVDVAVCDALGGMASEVWFAEGTRKKLFVFEFEEDVAKLTPDFAALAAASEFNVIATAPGDECDFVSRFFGPHVGINEDPVTGSAHCALVPYWARRLDVASLSARQISARGGELECELLGDRVLMTGRGVTFMTGEVVL